MNKFKSQFNIQEDLLKLAANKIYVDASSKLNSSQSKPSNNSNIGNLQTGSLLKTKK